MSDESPYAGTGEPPDPGPGGGQPPFPAYPPNPYGGAPYATPQRSDRWKIWVGIALAVPLLIATGVVAGAASAIDDSGALTAIIGLAGFVAPLVMLFFPGTRKLGLGLLIGYAVLFILAAGACVALLASYN
jgi:hypothetical protein